MLFKNVSEIKAILPIGVGNDFNRLKPHIENAENRYIKPLLGLDIYNALVTFIEIIHVAGAFRLKVKKKGQRNH
jgi:hypothetical protein